MSPDTLATNPSPASSVTAGIGRQISAGTIGGGVLVVVTIVTAIIHYKQVIGLLPREIAGLWLLFWSFGSYLAFFDLGISPTLSREISFLADKGDTERHGAIADLVATCFRIYFTVAMVLLLVSIAAGHFLLPTLRLTSISAGDVLLAWSLFAAGACVNLLGNLSFAVLTGEGYVATERVTRAVSMLLWLALSAYVLTAGHGLIGISLAWFINACIGRLMAVTVVKLKVRKLLLSRGSWQPSLARRLASPSARWALTQLGALLILQTANVVIAWNLGPAAIPSFEAASRVMMAVGTIALLGTNASVPYYSRAFAAGDLDGLRHLLYRNVQQTMITMAAAAAVLGAFAPDLFGAWLGHGNFVGFAVLAAMAVMMTLETHHVAHASLTMASGHIPFVRPAIVAGMLNLLMSLLLVRQLGVLGVALGTMLAQICTNNWYAPHVSLKLLHIHPRDYLRVMVPRFALLLLAFGALEAGLSAALSEQRPLVRLTCGIAAAAVLYLILIRCTFARVSPTER